MYAGEGVYVFCSNTQGHDVNGGHNFGLTTTTTRQPTTDVNNLRQTNGILEIYRYESWRPVCDTNWDAYNSIVVWCSLSFLRGNNRLATHTVQTKFIFLKSLRQTHKKGKHPTCRQLGYKWEFRAGTNTRRFLR